ncbi:MAG: YbjQ family protein [Clostridiales Family XIII bacterium]|jgi:uncharacterized protein YbjQ (UPF0145 family)|nr:YbjQ family protein [Clostridiales Family XIII bacterium]
MAIIDLQDYANQQGIPWDFAVGAYQKLPQEMRLKKFGVYQVDEENLTLLGFDEFKKKLKQESERLEQESQQEAARQAARPEKRANLIITSSPNIDGYRIVEYTQYLFRESVFGMGWIRGIAASLSNITGGESESLSTKLRQVRKTVIGGIKDDAVDLDCNAIISFDVEYTMFGDSLVAAIGHGTAVKIEKISKEELPSFEK